MSKPKIKSHPWVQTYSGKAFDLIDIDARNVDMEDIAHALGMLCRYAGHTKRFYSVGEHCIVVSQLVSSPAQLHGLVHDATEAYVVDLPRPVKQMLPAYQALEERISKAIYEHLELEPPGEEVTEEIKNADIRMYLTERNQLMAVPPKPWVWDSVAEPFDYLLKCWSPGMVSKIYLETFKKLRGEEV